jgi:hypothetical protein
MLPPFLIEIGVVAIVAPDPSTTLDGARSGPRRRDGRPLGIVLLLLPHQRPEQIARDTIESTWGISSALAYQIIPKVVVGVDLWYLRHYEGVGFNTFTGDAVFLGPTFYWHIAHHVIMSAAYETQIAGHEVGATPGNLDLTDFSRARARLLFEFEF